MSISSEVKSGACPECGSLDLSVDDSRGEIVCNSCGLVLEDNRPEPASKDWFGDDISNASSSKTSTSPQNTNQANASLSPRLEKLNKQVLSSNNSQPGENKWKEIRDHICQLADIDSEIHEKMLRRCKEMYNALQKQMFQSRRKPSSRTRTGRKKRIDNSTRGGKHPVMKMVVHAVLFIEEDRLDNTPIASKRFKKPPRKWALTKATLDPLVEKVRNYLDKEGYIVPEPKEIHNYIVTVLKALNSLLHPAQSPRSTSFTKSLSEKVKNFEQRTRDESKIAFEDDIDFTLQELGYGAQSNGQRKDIRLNVLETRDSVFDAMGRWKHGQDYPIPQPNLRRKCHCEVIYRVLKYHEVATTRKEVGDILAKLAKQPPHGTTVFEKWRQIADYVIKEVYK